MTDHTFRHRCTLGALALALTAGTAGADTVGLWYFDSMSDTNGAVGAGEQLVDSSGNDLHFTRATTAGTPSLSNDVASVMANGSTSLQSLSTSGFLTPSTTLPNIGNTGVLTVEFWFKPLLEDTARFILSQTGASGSWQIAQRPPSGGKFALRVQTTDDGGAFRSLDTAATLDVQDNKWVHLAFTIADDGAAKIYFDGVQAASGNLGANFEDAISQQLRLGASSTGSFVNQFRIDDLRISDQVLLPGAGTGEGELAWNSTLVPEPATAVLLLAGAGFAFSRRR